MAQWCRLDEKITLLSVFYEKEKRRDLTATDLDTLVKWKTGRNELP